MRIPEIIYEDKALLAVNKPAGLLSVATDTEKERTAYRLLKPGREGRLFVVHRLDRDTSGVLLFAKSQEIKDALQKNWEETALLREYLAVCEGVFSEKNGRCDTILRENSVHQVYSVSTDDAVIELPNGDALKGMEVPASSPPSMPRPTAKSGRSR
jgi:23S rRNA pseudouridine1911/1915/1917 synthase